MANTKSAERRARSNARKNLHNRSIKSKLKTLERNYLSLLNTGNTEGAATALRRVSSALDKAAKVGVVHRSSASRKKSRLSVRLNAATASPAPAPAPAPAQS